MPKITQVEPQKKLPHRFNIYLDGQFTFGADEDLVVEYRLIAGQEIPSDLLEKLLFEAEVGKLMERMYRLFTIRMRSEKEVRNYLKKLSFERKLKGKEEISDAAVELLIKKLRRKNLLNDEIFAKEWVEGRRRSKQKSTRALKTELIQKGIDREVIDKVLSEQSQGDGEEKLAEKALEKKLKQWQNLPLLEFKKKAYEFLARRSFDFSVIRRVVENKIKSGKISGNGE